MRFSVRHELDNIRRLLRAGKRQVSQEQLQRYATDGTLPDDPLTLAYLRLTEAALRCMESSVGGEGYDDAVEVYQQSLENYNNAVRGATL